MASMDAIQKGVARFIDAGGNVDLEILRESALERIPDEGIKIDVPLIGKMTFYRQDVETLYQFIV